MSRSGYDGPCEFLELYRANVDRAIAGQRGQALLKDMAAALDAMPEKRLIANELVTADGEVCAIGSVLKARGVDVSNVDAEDPKTVGALVGVAWCMAAEIAYVNDEACFRVETPEQRWQRVRKWVADNLK